jgi:TrmH family RNA methyltransferase
MESLADTVSPQGVLGVVRRLPFQPGYSPGSSAEDSANFSVPNPPLVLILDRIQDPGNLGTLLRTAEAAGVTAVWLLKGTADLFSPKVLRATMGSIFRVPIVTNVEAGAVQELRSQGVGLLAAAVEAAALPYYEADLSKPLALVLGNEANGLADWLKMASDQLVTIPLAGAAESLNAAVAGAVILFEVRRQRQAK